MFISENSFQIQEINQQILVWQTGNYFLCISVARNITPMENNEQSIYYWFSKGQNELQQTVFFCLVPNTSIKLFLECAATHFQLHAMYDDTFLPKASAQFNITFIFLY
jgi:hypothetical protein